MSNDRRMIDVRDPIHGAIRVTPRELQVIEHPVVQRLRGIKQLGFADFAFPGATHTRFAHSLGAMEMASRAFDAVFQPVDGPLGAEPRRRLRQTIRLALLLHDIGHAPLSHATEGCMPVVDALGLSPEARAEPGRRATHEDYTIKLLLDSELTEVLRRQFEQDGIDPRDIARLVTGRFDDRADTYVVNGIDYGPLLSQLVSGELDADRMDYLQRDSYYAGVNYGKFDDQWLVSNLTHHLVDGKAHLALTHRAIFAFEDFLLSRYHMFVSVYYHHTAVGLDSMLSRFIEEEPDAFVVPADPDAFIQLDDVAFWSTLRASKNRWAQGIVTRKLFRRVLEINADEVVLELPALQAALDDAGIDFFVSRDEGVLSQYYRSDTVDNPIFVINRALGRASRIDAYSKLYERYAQPTALSRLYCRPEQVELALEHLRAHIPTQIELPNL